MAVWKFGCNWAGNPNSFYSFIRDESIVIGHIPDAPFKLDDLVLITKGQTVLAIVQVDSTPQSITESDYRSVTLQYGIEWKRSTIFAKAEWYELPKALQFQYRLVQGACQVRNGNILKATKERWNKRKNR